MILSKRGGQEDCMKTSKQHQPLQNISTKVQIRKWRRGRDSNPRYRFRYTAFPVLHIRPLCHLSDNKWKARNLNIFGVGSMRKEANLIDFGRENAKRAILM